MTREDKGEARERCVLPTLQKPFLCPYVGPNTSLFIRKLNVKTQDRKHVILTFLGSHAHVFESEAFV